jgi:AcrR family transcriptional regulator
LPAATRPAQTTDVRDRILDAADRLIARFGYRKMTMDDVADEAGIGKGTIYLHFRSKEEVALGTLDRMVARLKERLRGIAGGPGSAPRRLRAMLLARVLHRFDAAQPHSKSIDELMATLRPALLQRREGYFRDEAAIFIEVLREGRASGALAVHDPEDVAHTLILATNALLPASLSVRELGSRSTIERRAGRIADLLLHGIVRRTPTPPRHSA